MEINNPQVHAELTTQFDRYQQALIDNDVAVLKELFWNHALTSRYGIGENLYGHADIATSRHPRAPQDLTQVVSKRVVTSYGHDAATTNIECTRVCPENLKLFIHLAFFKFLLMLDQRSPPSSDMPL